MAVVKFILTEDGRKAFNADAYRRSSSSAVYLEKGSMGMSVADDEGYEIYHCQLHHNL